LHRNPPTTGAVPGGHTPGGAWTGRARNSRAWRWVPTAPGPNQTRSPRCPESRAHRRHRPRTGDIDGDAALATAIAVAREIATDKGHVADATWAAALDAGWTDTQLLEVFLEVVRTIFTNYFNHLVGTELDLPAAPDLPS
jgi:alkylhydroperoxidase family enzyme